MEIAYKRELKHNYLILTPEEAYYDSYEIRMMSSNCIEGLLKFHLKQVDDRKSYYYEITSRQPLTRLLEFKSLGADDLCRLITGIVRTLERMETYLLQEGQILLDPDFIYVEPEYFTVYLCLVPGRQGIFPEEMTALLQYLLGKVNHQDKECVVMAYGLYQESLKENYGMENLLRIIGRGKSGNEDMRKDDKRKEERGEENSAADPWIKEEWEGEEQEQQRKKRELRQRPEEEKQRQKAEKQWPREEKQWQKERQREEPQSMRQNNSKRRREIFCNILVVFIVLAGGPAFCWFLYGISGLREYWLVLAAVDVAVIVYAAIRIAAACMPDGEFSENGFHENKGNTEYGEKESVRQWQMIFQDEIKEENTAAGGERRIQEPEVSSQEIATVLLTETERPSDCRRLQSMEAGRADIVIAYVPFIIGKQEGLADYVLACDTVSRIHARIDRDGEEYRITDLNSTNGTSVGGRLLEMNETVVLTPGTEVYIANIGFLFT